jgi:hypothetical protein
MSGSITRRGMLTGAAAVAGATALPRILTSARNATTTIAHLVVDARLIDTAALGDGFQTARVHTVSALDDLCNRWYTQLRRQVLADAGHIAGLTTWMDFEIMRSCAAEIGYIRSRDSWARALEEKLARTADGASGHSRITWVFTPRSI